MWIFLNGLAVFLLYATAALCAYQAVHSARTPQGAVGWVVFLLTLPIVALPVFMFLGHHRFKGYRIARVESRDVIEALDTLGQRLGPNKKLPEADALEEHENSAGSPDRAAPTSPYKPFEYCAQMPAIRGNDAQLLIDGGDAFAAMFNAIDAAKTYVLAQFYILRDDDLGNRFADHLIAAAQRGVKVRLMTDYVGSYSLPEPYCRRLRNAGVDMVDPHISRGPRHRFQINYRNHRKTLIIDGETGFTGGLNVGDEYIGLNDYFGHWRDTAIRLSGPMVAQLQLIFAEDWHWATGDVALGDLIWQPDLSDRDATGLIVATGPGDETERGALMFFSAIAQARHRVWIASPYFVPDTDIITALRNAALRGVDVRILIPDKVDHRMPWLAAWAYFDEILESGARVFRYTDGFLHQKVFVVDDTIAAVGTSNLDNRSFRLNFETMAVFFDAKLASQVDAMLRADFDRSYQLTGPLSDQPALVRYGAPIARLFAPLL